MSKRSAFPLIPSFVRLVGLKWCPSQFQAYIHTPWNGPIDQNLISVNKDVSFILKNKKQKERKSQKEKHLYFKVEINFQLKVINLQSLAHGYLEKERKRQRVGERDLWDPLAVFFCTAKMVARTPQKHKKMVAPINPVLLRETLKKASGLNEIQWLG